MEEVKSWVDELHDKYRHLFATYQDEGSTGSYYQKGQILRGIEVREPWKWVVEKFLTSIEWLTENRRYTDNPDWDKTKDSSKTNPRCIEGPKLEIKIFQIKEKFGQLRIYMESYPDRIKCDIDAVIAKAEARAELTCYSCGIVTDKLESTTKGWTVFICPKCMEEYNERQSKRSS